MKDLRVDHLVYGAPSLDAGSADLERLLGVRAAPGGKHPGAGTRNALLGLGPDCYLEIIAIDPDQPAPSRPRAFGLDGLRSARLVSFAVKESDLEHRVGAANAAGYDPGPILPATRDAPSGRLEWRFAIRLEPAGDGLVPFLIDWGTTPHPAASAPAGCTLLALEGEHPEPARVKKLLDALGVPLAVTQGSTPALVATLDTPKGRMVLR